MSLSLIETAENTATYERFNSMAHRYLFVSICTQDSFKRTWIWWTHRTEAHVLTLTLAAYKYVLWVCIASWMKTLKRNNKLLIDCRINNVRLLLALLTILFWYGIISVLWLYLMHCNRSVAKVVGPVRRPPKFDQAHFLRSTFMSVGKFFYFVARLMYHILNFILAANLVDNLRTLTLKLLSGNPTFTFKINNLVIWFPEKSLNLLPSYVRFQC